MGKITNIAIEYYEDNFDLTEVYAKFFSLSSIKFFESNYFLVDYDPVEFELPSNDSVKEVLLRAIKKYSEETIVFSVEFDNIITHHTINAVRKSQVNIAISTPKMTKDLCVPDFTYYLKKLLPHFNMYELKTVEFSYG